MYEVKTVTDKGRFPRRLFCRHKLDLTEENEKGKISVFDILEEG